MLTTTPKLETDVKRSHDGMIAALILWEHNSNTEVRIVAEWNASPLGTDVTGHVNHVRLKLSKCYKHLPNARSVRSEPKSVILAQFIETKKSRIL